MYGDPPSKDVTISVNDEIIYDLPGRGVDLFDISWCGQEYDISFSPVPMREAPFLNAFFHLFIFEHLLIVFFDVTPSFRA